METWSNLCRCCLRPDSEVAILNNSDENVKEKFFEITSIEVKSDDGLPQKLCTECYLLLNSAHTFRQQCIKMDTDLKSQLEVLLAKEMQQEEECSDKSLKQLQSMIKNESNDSDDEYYYVVVMDEKDKSNIPEETAPNDDLPQISIKLESLEDDPETDLIVPVPVPETQPNPKRQDNFESVIDSYVIDNNKVPDNVPATILENEEESQDGEEDNDIDDVAQADHVSENRDTEMEIDLTQDSNSQNQNWVEIVQDDQDMVEVADIESLNAVNSLLQNIPNEEGSSIIRIVTTSGKEGPILLKSGNNVSYVTTDGQLGEEDIDNDLLNEEEVILCEGDDSSRFQVVKCADGSELVIEYADEGQIATIVQQEDGSFLCDCGESFEDIKDYETHQNTHHPATVDEQDQNKICNLCGKCFESPEILTGHLYLHNVTGFIVNCPFCFQAFKRNTLTQHIKYSHNNIKPTCSVCEKTFANPNNLKRHMAIHTGSREFACDVCDRKFNQKISMQTHRMTHTNEFVCRLCDQIFAKKSLLDEHRQSGDCAQTNTPDIKKELINNLKQEIKSKNGKVLGYACSLCSRMFSIELALIEHIEASHMTAAEELLCSICGEVMNSKKHLSDHMLEHKVPRTPNKRFECSTCFKACTSQAMLIMHERVHTNERPFPCQLCSLSFKTKTHLRTHQLTHTREKKFGCSICMKFFALKGNLVVHLRTHTGERPYTCDLCQDSFIDSKYLKKHKAKKHSGALFVDNPNNYKPIITEVLGS